MNILILSPDFPYPAIYGGRIRRYYILKHLLKNNKVTFICFYSDGSLTDDIPDLPNLNIKVVVKKGAWKEVRLFSPRPISMLRFQSIEMKRVIRDILKRENFDLILVEYWYMGQYIDFLISLDKKSIKVLDEVDVEFVRRYGEFRVRKKLFLKSLLSYIEYLKTKYYEIKTVSKFDKCIAVSNRDKAALSSYLPNLSISVLPTCQDLNYYRIDKETNKKSNKLIFIGSFRHYPNVDAMVYFCEEIWPIIIAEYPGVKLDIVGLEPLPIIKRLEKKKNVTVVGQVDDVRPYLRDSIISIAPLRIGSGINGKITEAMAMGLPVVATSIGAAGLEIVNGKDIIVADGAVEFANRTVELLKNIGLRRHIAANGRRLVERLYEWEDNLQRFEKGLA